MDATSLECIDNFSDIRASEVYPKRPLLSDSDSLSVPFSPLPGEGPEYLGCTSDGIIALSNYRVYLSVSSILNIPIRLIDQIECRDIFFLYIHCKDGRSIRERMKENEPPQQEHLTENKNLLDIKNSNSIEQEKNVDLIVDEILDDLLAETVLDLHKAEKIKKSKITEQLEYVCQKLNDIESEETTIRQKWSTITFQTLQKNSSELIHHPIVLPTIIIKSPKIPVQNQNIGRVHLAENIRENWMHFKDRVQDKSVETTSLHSSGGIIMSKQEQKIIQGNFRLLSDFKSNTAHEKPLTKTVTMQHGPNILLGNMYEVKELGIGSEVLTNIYNYKKCFHQYLHRTSLGQKGKFNPLSIIERIAVSLLDDCLQDIAEELLEIPTALITDLYNQEFLQSSHM